MTDYFEHNNITYYDEIYSLVYLKESYNEHLATISTKLDNYELKTTKMIQNIDDLIFECRKEKNEKNKNFFEIREFINNIDEKFKNILMIQLKIQDIENNLRTIIKIILGIGPVRLSIYELIYEIKQNIQNSDSMSSLENHNNLFNDIIKNSQLIDDHIEKQVVLINNIILSKRIELIEKIPEKSKPIESFEPSSDIEIVLNTFQTILDTCESEDIYNSHVGCFHNYISNLSLPEYEDNLEQIIIVRNIIEYSPFADNVNTKSESGVRKIKIKKDGTITTEIDNRITTEMFNNL